MHKRQVLISISILFLLAALVVGLGQAQSRDPGAATQSQSEGVKFSLPNWASTTIPYTARLDDDQGQPVPGGNYTFSFAVYAGQTGGQPLWHETHEEIDVQNGSFSVSLGSLAAIPTDLMDGRTLWLEVGVRGPSEAGFTILSPRQLLDLPARSGISAPSACLHDHFGEVWTGSSNMQGLAITNTGLGNGLQVNQTGGVGVYVSQAGTDGVLVDTAMSDGFFVDTAGAAGLYVSSAGSNGVYVGSSVANGLHVSSSGTNGLFVGSSGSNGVQVNSAGSDGVHVTNAGDDGVYVHQAGNPSTVDPSSYANGFEVAGAQGSGLYVGQADLDGVTVESAGWYGLYVVHADDDGVRVDSASGNGIYARTESFASFGGRFLNTAAGGAGLYASGGDNASPDLILGAFGAGDDGRIYSDPTLTGSDLLLFSNDEAHIHIDEDNNSDSTFTIYNGTNTAVFSVNETPKVTVAGPLVTRVETADYGARSAYALQATGNWYEDFGTAQLSNGTVSVPIDPIFSQVVSLAEYHVFLTPLGECSLYVVEKTSISFTVKAMGSPGCSIAFDYRIVAERLGSEGLHLEPMVTSPEHEDD